MPSKKKKFNARFPPARIKKIMQTDEDVGKVASPVPVIISRALELFIESLIVKAADTTRGKNAKTLTIQHVKQTITGEKNFDFLKDLVANVPDIQQTEEDEGPCTPDHPRPRGRPRKKKMEGETLTPKPRKRKRKNSRKESTETDSATEEADTEDDGGEGESSQPPAMPSHHYSNLGYDPQPSTSHSLVEAKGAPEFSSMPAMPSTSGTGSGDMKDTDTKAILITTPQIAQVDEKPVTSDGMPFQAYHIEEQHHQLKYEDKKVMFSDKQDIIKNEEESSPIQQNLKSESVTMPNVAMETTQRTMAQNESVPKPEATVKPQFFRPFQTSPQCDEKRTQNIPAQITSAMSPRPCVPANNLVREHQSSPGALPYAANTDSVSSLEIHPNMSGASRSLYQQSFSPRQTSSPSRPVHHAPHERTTNYTSSAFDQPQDLSRNSPGTTIQEDYQSEPVNMSIGNPVASSRIGTSNVMQSSPVPASHINRNPPSQMHAAASVSRSDPYNAMLQNRGGADFQHPQKTHQAEGSQLKSTSSHLYMDSHVATVPPPPPAHINNSDKYQTEQVQRNPSKTLNSESSNVEYSNENKDKNRNEQNIPPSSAAPVGNISQALHYPGAYGTHMAATHPLTLAHGMMPPVSYPSTSINVVPESTPGAAAAYGYPPGVYYPPPPQGHLNYMAAMVAGPHGGLPPHNQDHLSHMKDN